MLNIHRIFESPEDGHYFFGYFNTIQVSRDGTKLLALKCEFIDRVPNKEDSAIVGYFDLYKDPHVFHKLGETRAFNWQQGCMLQFCGPDYDSKIIYNNFDGKKYVSEIIDINSGARKIINSPIYSMFPSGDAALTLDFARHYWCRRGYSYGNIIDAEKNNHVVEGDGIWHLDIGTQEHRQIISLKDMIALKPLKSMENATHYLEHMEINPAGNKFVFLHRWKYPGGIHSRLCVADRNGENVRTLNDSGRMSHYCWKNNDAIIGYGGSTTSLNKMRKSGSFAKKIFKFLLPIYHSLIKDSSALARSLTGDSYMEIDVLLGKIRKFGKGLPNEDGHPAMLIADRIMVTDTYARSNLGQKARLFAYDLYDDTQILLDELGSIDEHDETAVRCDLHPCISPERDIITVDTMDRGRRGIYAYKVELLNE